MQSMGGPDNDMIQDSGQSATCGLWPVELKLTHLDWSPEATLVHFQGQYLTTCELDYNILQREIQNVPKTPVAVGVGEFCLVEDLSSAHWYRGRIQNQNKDKFDVFLIDHGNVLSVDISHVSSCSNDLLILPPKIVCGFLANVLLLQSCSHSVVDYLSSLSGRSIKGFIQAVLPHSIILLEALDINEDLVKHGFARQVDTDTFLFLVEMLTEVSLKKNMKPLPDLITEPTQQFSFKSYTLKGYKDFLSFCGARLSCGTRARVRVTAAVNPGLFYCQKAGVKAELCQLSKELAVICECKTKEHSPKTPEKLGPLCVAKRKDGKWYRGFLLSLPVNSQIRVLFADYGFSEYVKAENVHSLPPRFYSTPIMAFPCSLPSLTDQDQTLKAQQLHLLKVGLLGGILKAQINGFNEQHLYTITFISSEDKQKEEPKSNQKAPSETVNDSERTSPQGGYVCYETVLNQVLDEALDTEEVQVGSAFVGYVEHAQNPHHFWIRTQKRNDEFEEMMDKMTDHFSQIELDEDILINPDVGAMCCALYEKDMHFYRAFVTNTLTHGAEVLFIDFGNVEKVPHMLIKTIPETFASKAAFAVCCTLDNVFPLDDFWSSASCDFFRKIVSNKAVHVRVVEIRNSKLVVDLSEMGSNKTIAELLVQYDLYGDEHLHINPFEEVTATGKCSEDTMSLDNSGTSEHWEESELYENVVKQESDQAEATASLKSLNIKPGFDLAVCCSCINSPSEFWCQPLGTVPDLEKLMDEINQYYSVQNIPLQPGELCCVAKSPHNGRWYRGFITGEEKAHVTVLLVDYGSLIQVKEQSLQAIMPEYVSLEGQAFRCCLHNPTEAADQENCGEWMPDACKLLKDFILSSAGSLNCKVVSQLDVKNKGLCNVVCLYNARTKQNITTTLLEQGVAVETGVSTKHQSEASLESFVYSAFDLCPGGEEQVFITHVSSQCEVYCQLDRNTEIIDELERRISEEIDKMAQPTTRAKVKKLCLAEYMDGNWYRGLAMPTLSPLHLNVFYVDYGNSNICEKNKVLFIPRDCADLLCTPIQAVRFNLASVPKEELCAEAKEWLNEAVLNKLVKAVVCGKREDGSFDVELFDGEMNINEKLKEIILSLLPKPMTALRFAESSSEIKSKFHQTRNKQRPFKCMNVRKEKTSATSTKAFKGKRGKDITQILLRSYKTEAKQQTKSLTNCYAPVKPQRDPKLDQQQDAKQIKHIREAETPRKFSCLPRKILRTGSREKCFVSHLDSASSFFLQLSEDEPAILKMYEQFRSAALRDSLKRPSSFEINDVVLAEFEEDSALYRSVLKTKEDGSRFRVEYVDYGNSAVVLKENIYSLPGEYRSLPRFSIPCSLLNSSLYDSSESFADAVMDKPLMVDFVQRSGLQWHVKVEVLDKDVGLVDTPKSSFSSEDSRLSLPETKEKGRTFEENLREESLRGGPEQEFRGVVSTYEGKNSSPEPLKVHLSTKPKVRTFRAVRRKWTKSTKQRREMRSVQGSRNSNTIVHSVVKVGEVEDGLVLSVQSDGSFYIRLKKTNDLLTALERLVADNVHRCVTVSEYEIARGLECLVQVRLRWLRAVVLHPISDKWKVFLVDHGIVEEVSIVSIRHRHGELMNFPSLALLCKANSASKTWCETLKAKTGTEVRVVFVRRSEFDDLWEVEVLLHRYAQTSPSQNGETTSSSGEPQKQNQEPKEEVSGVPGRIPPPPLASDRRYSTSTATVASPSDFFLVPDHLRHLRDELAAMLDDLPERAPPLPEAHRVPGAGCLWKSDSEQKWRRAEIVGVGGGVSLRLVDLGGYQNLSGRDSSRLRALPVEITNIPMLTCPCVLRGVEPVGGQWTNEATALFQQCLNRRNLQVFFREFVSNSYWKVDVLSDGVYVAKELVDAGYATFMDVLLGLRFQVESSHDPLPEESEEEEGCEGETSDGPERKMSAGQDSGKNQCKNQ
uniref:(Atlantic silverside) hypothetical protein n=1 Tax=Menidia menidia TaxID=238744 RepID=A0A8S4AS68_9TELE|nr:unnamed protein product [Menidia menidia]